MNPLAWAARWRCTPRGGMQVHLVCATRGEVGEVSPDLLEGFESIAKLRESELRCAAGVLGLSGVHFLDYRELRYAWLAG